MDHGTLTACLEKLERLHPYDYAQWLEEDRATFEYRVIAERIPSGGEGYVIAHRTGVIGQVFRTRKAIYVADARNHPLYDPFDAAVGWELAIPVWRGDSFAGVLNLEGSGTFVLDAGLWKAIGDLVGRIAAEPPDPHADVLVATTRRSITRAEIMDAGRQLAGEGRTVLIVVAETLERCLPVAECIQGLARRLDLLRIDGGAEYWRLVDGRYDFVLVEE